MSGISPTARAPTGAIVEEPLKETRAAHPSKELAPMEVKPGAKTVVKDAQFLNELAPIVVTFGMNTSVKLVFINASAPILVRL